MVARPLSEPPLTSVCEAARSTFGGLRQRARDRLPRRQLSTQRQPRLPRALVRTFLRWEDRLAVVLHERYVADGADPYDEVYSPAEFEERFLEWAAKESK